MDKFSSRHVFFIICGTVIVSLKTYPSAFTRLCGRDAWLALAVASILGFVFSLYIIHIFKKSGYISFSSIYYHALGKTWGKIFLFFFIITLFFTLIECVSIESNSMHTNMNLEIPIWQFMALMIPSAIYTVKRGKPAIIIVTIIAMVLVSVSGMNLAALTAKYKHLDYIFPIMEKGITPGFVRTVLEVFGLYGCIAIVFTYIVDIKDHRKMKRMFILGTLYVVQMEIVSISGAIMTFEVDFLNTMLYPKLLQTQLVSHFRFLEAGELYVMLQIVGGWFIKYVLTYYAIIQLIEGMKIKINYFGVWLGILNFAVSYPFANNTKMLFEMIHIYAFICLVNYIILPTIIFSIYAIRGFPGANKEEP